MSVLKRGVVSFDQLRHCTLVLDDGTRLPASIDRIMDSPDTAVAFEGTFDLSIDESRDPVSYYGGGGGRVSYSSYHGAPKADRKIEIKNVIFHDPATIVYWTDGSKTVVKCQPGDTFDPEKGLAMAIVKKTYGNKGNYCNTFKKWMPKEEVDDAPVKDWADQLIDATEYIRKLAGALYKGLNDE